ncbi:MAG: hypothetical protein EBR88_02060 [Betaproteobacteria bacterium]|nr:hypothetical protein [Betaproteobacteria bacterium]
MKKSSQRVGVVAVLLAGLGLQGCAVIAVADAAVTVTATVVGVGVKATGAVVDAIIPGSPEPESKPPKK